MKEKIVPVLIIIGLFLAGYVTTSLIINTKNNNIKNAQTKENSKVVPVVLTKNTPDGITKVKTVKITDEKEIENFKELVKDIHVLDNMELVSLAIPNEIEIHYKDITISTSVSSFRHCYYKDDTMEKSAMALMSEKLTNFIKDELDI